MKKLLLLSMVVVAAWIGMTWGGIPVAGASPFKSPQPPKQVTKYTFKGDNAYADFFSSQDCISTYASVQADESVSKDGPGKAVSNSSVFLILQQYDGCSGQSFLGIGSADLSADAFSLKGKLQSATLNATVQLCCDQNGFAFPATVNLTWAGTGAISSGKSTYTSKAPGCKISYSSQGDFRSATASGSIAALGTQFAAQPTTNATLSSSKSGSMQVGCN